VRSSRRSRLPRQKKPYALVVQHHAIAPDAFDRRAFLQLGTFVIFAIVDVHEALRRLGCINMNVEMQFGQRLRAAEWPGLSAWLSQLENPPWQSLITELLADGRPIPDEETLLKGSPTRNGMVKILRDKHIERRLAAINQRLAAPETPEAEQNDLLTESQHLRRLKIQPLAARSDESV